MQLWWAWYLRALSTHPLLTRSLTAAALSGGADAVAQRIEGAPYAPGRTARLVSWAFIVTPAISVWYSMLAGLSSPWARMGADQLLFAPASLAAFLFFSGAVEQRSAAAGGAALRAKFWTLLKANYLVWPLVSLANFSLVPPALQILFLGVASFFWQIFLSLTLHAAPAPHPAAQGRLAALQPPLWLLRRAPADGAAREAARLAPLLPAAARLAPAAAQAARLPRRDANHGGASPSHSSGVAVTPAAAPAPTRELK